MPEKTLNSGEKFEKQHTERLQQEIQAEILEVLENNPGVHLPQIAQILGAEEFLVQTEAKKKGGQPGLRFNISGYIKERVRQGKLETIHLPKHVEQTDKVIIPPDEIEIITGTGAGWEKPKFIPRTEYLMEILSELETEYDVVIGTNTPEMMRGESYQVFIMLDLNKIVFINNEEGNATFIVHHLEPDESWEDYSNLTKEQLPEFEKSGLVTRTIFRGEVDDWKKRILDLLNQPFKSDDSERQEDESSQKIDENWKTIGAIKEELGVDFDTVKKLANQERDKHPEWFITTKKRGRPSYEYLAPELIEIISTKIQERVEPKKNWLSAAQLRKELRSNNKIINYLISQYRKDYPDWFEIAFSGSGEIEYLAPELCDLIRKKIEDSRYIPENWISRSQLLKEFNITNAKTIENVAKKIEGYDKSTYDRYALIGKRKLGTYYSPELAEKIREVFLNQDSPPENWITVSSLAKSLDVDYKVIKKLSNEQLEIDSEGIKEIKLSSGRTATYISPELIKIFSEKISAIEHAPPNWKTAHALGKELNIAPATTSRFANQFKSDHPDWFKFYKLESGPIRLHFSPEIIELLKEEIKKREAPPEDWIANTTLSKEIGKSQEYTQAIADLFREDHPDWFKMYYKTEWYEYYSPELIQAIKDEIEKRKRISDEWKTNKWIADKFSSTETTIKRIASPFRQTNPEWYKMMDGKTGYFEHYSPELTKLIENELEKRKPAPEGWLGKMQAAKDIGIYYLRFEKMALPYRDTNPEWFHFYLDKAKKYIEHYSPELIAQIKKDLEK
ncbi:hypothetical protein KKC88_01005 [Patescibacteria group bacterium]|nr:hypothetical protein [Patescibacteria group bacterium]MBU1673338.1 hypothetical protein [Patescibacteria group bacterium]MBU1963543.1 hypothetical protein [Patescibacteria group bacterium]